MDKFVRSYFYAVLSKINTLIVCVNSELFNKICLACIRQNISITPSLKRQEAYRLQLPPCCFFHARINLPEKTSRHKQICSNTIGHQLATVGQDERIIIIDNQSIKDVFLNTRNK